MKKALLSSALLLSLSSISAATFSAPLLPQESPGVTPEQMPGTYLSGWAMHDNARDAKDHFADNMQPGTLQFHYCKKLAEQWGCQGYHVSYNIERPYSTTQNSGTKLPLPIAVSKSSDDDKQHVDVQYNEFFFGAEFTLHPAEGGAYYEFTYRDLPVDLDDWPFDTSDRFEEVTINGVELSIYKDKYDHAEGFIQPSKEPQIQQSEKTLIWIYSGAE